MNAVAVRDPTWLGPTAPVGQSLGVQVSKQAVTSEAEVTTQGEKKVTTAAKPMPSQGHTKRCAREGGAGVIVSWWHRQSHQARAPDAPLLALVIE